MAISAASWIIRCVSRFQRLEASFRISIPALTGGAWSFYISMWDLASGEQLECPPSRGRGLEFRSRIAKFSLR
jgi:hypothetical protein